MNDERREPMRNNGVRSDNNAKPRQVGAESRDGNDQREHRGPFTYAAGWLGTAFDRSRINKHDAEERRSRNM